MSHFRRTRFKLYCWPTKGIPLLCSTTNAFCGRQEHQAMATGLDLAEFLLRCGIKILSGFVPLICIWKTAINIELVAKLHLDHRHEIKTCLLLWNGVLREVSSASEFSLVFRNILPSRYLLFPLYEENINKYSSLKIGIHFKKGDGEWFFFLSSLFKTEWAKLSLPTVLLCLLEVPWFACTIF